MITKLLNGNIIYNKYLYKIKEEIEKCYKIYKKFPSLSILIVNNDFSSNLYVKNNIIYCKKNLFVFYIFKSSKTIKESLLKNIIRILNEDDSINSILIQKPIPKKIKSENIFELISLKKDVDLMNSLNNKKYIIKPCITQSIIFFLEKFEIKYNKLNCVIFGFSDIVGKPIFEELFKKNINLTVISKDNKNFYNILRFSDMVVIGIGVPLFLSKNMVSYGNMIFDVGVNKFGNDIVGDCNIKELYGKSSWITPVPGGIGPLTIFYLLKNTLDLYLYQKK